MKNAYPYVQIRIEGNDSLEEVAAILSDKLFGGIPFGDKDLGLFEEVPGLRLKRQLLGLFVGLHGFDGNYTLIMQPTSSATIPGLQHVNISNYIASLLSGLGRWNVIVVRSD
jgi:hypothetical protein